MKRSKTIKNQVFMKLLSITEVIENFKLSVEDYKFGFGYRVLIPGLKSNQFENCCNIQPE